MSTTQRMEGKGREEEESFRKMTKVTKRRRRMKPMDIRMVAWRGGGIRREGKLISAWMAPRIISL